MYRINLYPEYQQKKLAAKRRTVLTAALTIVAGLQLVVIGSFLVSTNFITAEIDSVETELPRLHDFIANESRIDPGLETAKELLDLRRARADWAPKLASLSHAVEKGVELVKLEGRQSGRDGVVTFQIAGEAGTDSEQLDRIGSFISRLREDEAFGPSFAAITLGNVMGDHKGGFDLICNTEEDDQ